MVIFHCYVSSPEGIIHYPHYSSSGTIGGILTDKNDHRRWLLEPSIKPPPGWGRRPGLETESTATFGAWHFSTGLGCSAAIFDKGAEMGSEATI